MLGVTFICVGRMREAHFIAAFAEYEKRLGALCRFELKEIPETKLPERPAEAEIAAALKKEGEAMKRRCPGERSPWAMCIEGRQTPSEGLARMLAAAAEGGRPRVCFIVGGSYGLDEGLKRRADVKLSMSEMTFPHHLARVMLAEQVYRALMINNGSRYHK